MRRLAAAAAVAFGVGAATLLPGAPAASAATPRHVALVVAGQGTWCVSWQSGMTGSDVLDEAGVQPVYRRDGVLVQINGYPSSATADNSHYWSYWHDLSNGNGWAYSNYGPAYFNPVPGTVEGWSYDNGAASPPRPPSTSYSSICAGADAPPPPPPPSTAPVIHPTTARHTAPAPAPRTVASHRVAPTSGAGVLPVSAHKAAAPTARRTSARPAAPAARRSGSPTTSAAGPADAASSPPAAPASTATRAAPKHASGSAVPAVAGAGLAAIIAAGGGWAAWRRRRG